MKALAVERALIPFRAWLGTQKLSPSSVKIWVSYVGQALSKVDPDATAEDFLAYARKAPQSFAHVCSAWRWWIAYCQETGVWQPEPLPKRVAHTSDPSSTPSASPPVVPASAHKERLVGEIESLEEGIYLGLGREWQIHPGERGKITLAFEWRGGQHTDEINLRAFAAREAFIQQVAERFSIDLADLRRDLDLLAHQQARRPTAHASKAVPPTPPEAPVNVPPLAGEIIEHTRDHMVLRYGERTWTFKGLARARQNITRSLYLDVTLVTPAGPFPQGSLDLNQRIGSLPRRLAHLARTSEAVLAADLHHAQTLLRNPPAIVVEPPKPVFLPPPPTPRIDTHDVYAIAYKDVGTYRFSPEGWVDQVAQKHLEWLYWYPLFGSFKVRQCNIEEYYASCAQVPVQAPHLYRTVYARLLESEAAFARGEGNPHYPPYPPQPPESPYQHCANPIPQRPFHELFPDPDTVVVASSAPAGAPDPEREALRVLHQQADRTWTLLFIQPATEKSREAFQIEVTTEAGVHAILLPSDATPEQKETLLLSVHFHLRGSFADLQSDFAVVCAVLEDPNKPAIARELLPVPVPVPVVPVFPPEPTQAPPVRRAVHQTSSTPPSEVLGSRRRAKFEAKVREAARAAREEQRALAQVQATLERTRRELERLQEEAASQQGTLTPVYELLEDGLDDPTGLPRRA